MKTQKTENKYRSQRVAARLQQDLGSIIAPILEGKNALVTISQVEVTSDCKHAVVWISILGGNDDSVLKTLQRNIYDIQGESYKKLNLKIAPKIHFKLDTAPRYAQHIDEVIRKIHEEEAK